MDRQRRELEVYTGKIGRLKRSLNTLLLEMSSETDSMEKECAELEGRAPVIKLVTLSPASGVLFPTRDKQKERLS